MVVLWRFGRVAASAALVLGLAGCSGVTSLFGDDTRTDEFLVFEYPPLTVPPDLLLRPPLEERPQSDVGETTELVLGLTDSGRASADLDEGERALLRFLEVPLQARAIVSEANEGSESVQ